MPVAEEDENGEVELFIGLNKNEDGTEGELQPIPEDSEDEWNMIEAPQQLYGRVKMSGTF